MKNTIKTIMIFVLLSVNAFSNTSEIDYEAVNTDSVNIRGILDKQISEIRERESQSDLASRAEVVESKIVNDELGPKHLSVLTEEDNGLKKIFKSFLLFVELSLLVMLGYFVKKRYDKINRLKVIELKRNVKDLREEKIGSFTNREMSLVRMKLNNTKIDLKDSGRDITQKAKSLAISKGEIHLAAKIKMMSQLN